MVSDIQNIAASQLFSHAKKDENRHLRRSSSQPNMMGQHGRYSSFTRCPRRDYSPHGAYFSESYWDKKANINKGSSTTSITKDEGGGGLPDNFETMYEIIQRKLQKHLRREEIFSREEIQNACQELRRQALVTELEDGWQNSLSDLEVASGMKLEVLEAIYMLRNAHKGDLFSSQESVDNNQEQVIIVIIYGRIGIPYIFGIYYSQLNILHSRNPLQIPIKHGSLELQTFFQTENFLDIFNYRIKANMDVWITSLLASRLQCFTKM